MRPIPSRHSTVFDTFPANSRSARSLMLFWSQNVWKTLKIGMASSSSRSGVVRAMASSSSSPRRSVSFRSAEAAATATTITSTASPSRCGSSSSSSSLTSLAPVHSVTSSTSSSGSSHLTCLTSAESLDDAGATFSSTSTTAAAGGVTVAAAGSPSRRPRSSAVNSDLHHLRHSGDSGDSGVSSPGPPSSEASEQKNSEDGCSDNLSYMDRVVMEVVESEAVYVRDLQQVVEVNNAICPALEIHYVKIGREQLVQPDGGTRAKTKEMRTRRESNRPSGRKWRNVTLHGRRHHGHATNTRTQTYDEIWLSDGPSFL